MIPLEIGKKYNVTLEVKRIDVEFVGFTKDGSPKFRSNNGIVASYGKGSIKHVSPAGGQ